MRASILVTHVILSLTPVINLLYEFSINRYRTVHHLISYRCPDRLLPYLKQGMSS